MQRPLLSTTHATRRYEVINFNLPYKNKSSVENEILDTF